MIVEKLQDQRYDDGCGNDADNLEDLLAPGRRADNVATLQVLHVVAGNCSGRANKSGEIDYGDGSECLGKAFVTHQLQQNQRRDNDGCDCHTGNRIVRAANEPRHITGD